MTLVERMTNWSMTTGVKQLSLSPKKGLKFADHMRHLHHHLSKLRQCNHEHEGLVSRHLVACSSILSKIAFEAALIGVDINFEELEDIQREIKYYLNNLLDNDDHHISSDRLVANLHLLSGDPN